jgi:putative ABC transport system permease protein
VSGLLGGLLGLALATLLVAAGGRLVASAIPRSQEIGISLPVVFFALATGIGAGVLAGVWPAVRLPWDRLVQEIREGGRGAGAGERQSSARRVMVVAEVALTLTVLTGAALLVRSLRQLQSADPGFVPANVLTFRLTLPESSYPDSLPDRFARFSDQLRHRLGALPGVRSAALAGALPPADLQLRNTYTVEGTQPDGRGPGDVAPWIVADTGYFRAMGIPLLAGRSFTALDLPTSPLVAVVSQEFARKHFGDADPVGRRLKSGDWDPAAPWITIVGVAGDVPYDGGVWDGTSPTVYLAYAQNPWWTSPFVILAGARDLTPLLPRIQREVASIDPDIPLRDVASLEQRLARSAASPRLRGTLSSALGVMALVLALTGIYGLLAHEVGQRERETAVRRAMGATTGAVVRLVVASGMRLALIGVGIGTVGALILMRLLRGFLYGVTPADPLSLTAAALALLAAAFAACLVPARRAARVEPMAVLRSE